MVSEYLPDPGVAVVPAEADSSQEPVVDETVRKPPPRSAPKWETDARHRVREAVKRFSRPLQDLVARDANEGDTRLLVTDFLCYGLGYDKYEDLTTEYEVKGDFADYGVRIDKQLVAFHRGEAVHHQAQRAAPSPGPDVRGQ